MKRKEIENIANNVRFSVSAYIDEVFGQELISRILKEYNGEVINNFYITDNNTLSITEKGFTIHLTEEIKNKNIFNIACKLGYFFLYKEDNNLKDDEEKKRRRMESVWFASELLMPHEFILKNMNDIKKNIYDVACKLNVQQSLLKCRIDSLEFFEEKNNNIKKDV